MWANQNSSCSFSFLWRRANPTLSNWIMSPTFSFSSSYSPSPFFVSPFGIRIFTLMLSGVAGSQCRNFVLFWESCVETKEKSRGFIPDFWDLKVRRCIRRYS